MVYNLFISHSWSYSNTYEGLIKLLDSDSYFYYRNYSVPKDDPVHDAQNEDELLRAIMDQIKPCSAVLVLAGVYAEYSKWIQKEISIANYYKKPIIGIEYFGSERTSSTVRENAVALVKWNSKSIIDAIKRYG